MVEELVELGFLEESESWRLESYLFPSKIGGKPAWLSLENLPKTDDLQCENCGNGLIFLCQLYAPFEENSELPPEHLENNFHRTLFAFICRNGKCCVRNSSGNVKILRDTLKRDNKFYPFDPPSEELPNLEFSITKWTNLCQLCGIFAEKKCSSCRNIYYCTRQHQVLDWKQGHKEECGTESEAKSRKSSILFLEGELVTEPEELTFDDTAELEKFEKLAQNNCSSGTMQSVSENELDAYSAQETDSAFQKFQKRVRHNPKQVIRYKRGGKPLWIVKEPMPENIPNCEYCNGPRQFEFQIMPQMLTLLKENELDWGVITVFTCKISCTNTSGYKKEFVFKQDVQLDNLQTNPE